jgi:hypothetical protein
MSLDPEHIRKIEQILKSLGYAASVHELGIRCRVKGITRQYAAANFGFMCHAAARSRTIRAWALVICRKRKNDF